MTYSTQIQIPLGLFTLHSSEKGLTQAYFSTDPIETIENDILKQAKQQLIRYFQSPIEFNLPLDIQTTPFQTKLLNALQQIPPNSTRTYGELAKTLRSSPRAVGQACRRNPLPIIIPCHRVVGANQLGGYFGQLTGPLMDAKRWLLNHES